MLVSRPELSLADGVSTLQLQSSGTRFQRLRYSEMGLEPTYSYKPTREPLCLSGLLTVESPDLETSFTVCRYIFRISS